MLKISAPFSWLTAKDRSLLQKTIGAKLTKVVEGSKEDIITDSYPMVAGPTVLVTANEAPLRPSCVPCNCIPQSSVDVTLAFKGRQGIVVKAVIPRPRSLGIKLAVNIPTTRAAAHAVVTGSYVKNPSVFDRHPRVSSTQNDRLTLRNPVKSTTANKPFL